MSGPPTQTSVRLLGSGYEPHVDAVDGQLIYSILVDSSFVSLEFSFAIEQRDLDVLVQDPYRGAVLECVAFTVLQRSMILGNEQVTQEAFSRLVAQILHGAPADVVRLIATINDEHNTDIGFYVAAAIARQKR